MVFKDFIIESTISCVGSEKHEQWFWVDVKLGLSCAELMYKSTLIILEMFCSKKLINNAQRTKSGGQDDAWSGFYLHRWKIMYKLA